MARKKDQYTQEERIQYYDDLRAGFQRTADAALEQLVADLDRGATDHLKKYLKFMGRQHRYSPDNQRWIFSQCVARGIEPTLLKGAKQWEQEGFKVAADQFTQGIAIQAPQPWKKQVVNHKTGAEEEKSGVGFRVVWIYDASQLDEESQKRLPQFFLPLAGDAEDIYAAVKRAVESDGIVVEYAPARTMGQTQGYSQGGKIVQRDDLVSVNRTLNLVHEWAHEVLEHVKQLQEGQVDRHSAEIVAAVEYVVGQNLGLDFPFAADYLLSHGITSKALKEQLELVQSVSKKMIEKITREASA